MTRRSAFLPLLLLTACVGGASELGVATGNLDNADPACAAIPAADRRAAAIELYDNRLDNPTFCFDDSNCPCGTYCSVDALCEVDCVASPPPGELACGAGQACTSTGRCGDAPTDPPPPLALSIAFDQLETAANTASSSAIVPITLTTSATGVAALDDAETATVHFSIEEVRLAGVGAITNPPPVSPQLRCGTAGPFANECDVAGGWIYNVTPGGIRSQTRTIWVQVPQTASPLHWTLEARSPNASGTAREVIDATPIVAPPTDPGRYKGTLSFANDGGSANQALAIPVEAIVTPTAIVVLEPTKLVFPDGQVAIPRTTAKAVQLGWLGATGGSYDVLLRYTDAAYDPMRGHLDANVELVTGTGAESTSLTLALDRTGDADAHACPCDTGSYCNTMFGLCFPGSAAPTEDLVDPATAVPSSTLPSAGVATWTATLLAAAHTSSVLSATGTAGFQEAYCYDPSRTTAGAFGWNLTMSPLSGDMYCATSLRQQTFSFEDTATEFDDGSSGGATYDLFATCLQDLAATPSGTTLATLIPSRSCASLGRFFLALAANRDAAGVGHPMADVDQRLVMQLLRQWLGLNAYVASTAVQDRDYDDALTSSTAPANQRLGTAVDQVDADLRVLLDPEVHPQFTSGAGLPRALDVADYRVRLRPVARWAFNVNGASSPDSEGANALTVTGASVSGGLLHAQGGTTSSCASSQPVAAGDHRFSIAFALDFKPPTSSTTTVFDKLAANGDRLRIDATSGATLGSMNLRMYDSLGGSVSFTNVPSGMIAISVEGTGYVLYYAPADPTAPHVAHTVLGTALVGRGPAWGAAGTVRLNCNLPPNPDICTSWDHNVIGDGLDYSTRAPFTEHSATWRYTCTDWIAPPFTRSCTGTPISAQTCTNIANARRPALIAQINATPVSPVSSPPAAKRDALLVQGGVATLDEQEVAHPKFITSWTDWRCDTRISNYIDPITGNKPVCGWYGQASWDEVSIWDRPIQLAEFTDMAARYGAPANESIPAPTEPAGKEQAAGLPVHLLEAASADLALLTAYAAAEHDAMYGECYLGGASPARDRLAMRGGKNLRLVALLEGEAEHLAAIAGTTPAWYPRYEAAHRELAGRRALAVQALIQGSQCTNPLGITEQDIPMFVGEEVGASARFYASSRYLTAKAREEIAAADGKLGLARTAYTSQREQAYQLVAARETTDERLTRIRADFESQIMRLCGPAAGSTSLVDGFLAGTIAPNTCFLNTSMPACTATTTIADLPPECLRGELGNELLAIKTAQIVVANANNTLQNTIDRYDGDLEHCAQEQAAFEADEQALRDHDAVMGALHAESSLFNRYASLTKLAVNFATRDAVGAVGTLLNYRQQDFADAAQAEQTSYQEGVLHRSDDVTIAKCYHEVDNEKFQIDTARDQITLTQQQLVDTTARFTNDTILVGGIASEAAGQIATEQGLDATPPHLHYWLDQSISEYHRHLEYARRLTYLALRAFEYESQGSIGQRTETLTAAHPDDLLQIVIAIESHNAPLAGGPVLDTHPHVFSVRDEILKLSTTTTNVPGDPQLTPVEQLQRFLASDSSKILDVNGRLVGRGIRFALAPDAWSQTMCDERIWRIEPSVQIDNPPNQRTMVLYQDNTFGSQDCAGEVGSVLLTCANAAASLLVGDATTFTPTSSFTAVNIDGPASLDRDLLAGRPESSIAGFAGRGLYGNYVLLFPQPLWSDAAIASVKDVLLRFDVDAVTHAPPL